MTEGRVKVKHSMSGIEYHLPRISGRFHLLCSISILLIIIACISMCILPIFVSHEFDQSAIIAIFAFTGLALIILPNFLVKITAVKILVLDSTGLRISKYFYGCLWSDILVPFGPILSIYRNDLPKLYSNNQLKVEDYYWLLKRRNELGRFLRNEIIKPRFLDNMPIMPGNFGCFSTGGGVILETKQGAKLIICDT